MIRMLGRSALVAVGLGAAVYLFSWPAARAEAVDDAFRRGGFRAVAALKGTYEKTIDGVLDDGPQTASDLVRGSAVVLIGRTISNHGVLSPRGDSIRTHYLVQPIEVIKDDGLITPGERIVVSVLGGRVGFGPGSWAQLNVRYFDPPMNGNQYLFCLNRADLSSGQSRAVDSAEADFWPLHGSSGIFGLGQGNGGLRPADRKHTRRPILLSARGNTGALLREVRQVARER